ncbi:MAG: endonuclease [Deltaproteobacteria bacterium HGW-Deltaproteobacteria-14]|jgi:phosphatidylserine/phosphatidylglycerophosphate/cardiolipin synthase-like enzyme|nr:MAG: endonuclease [Deltaproteobacteria bacterium HGW-Deltaproteobacteria-14]
MNDAEIDRVLIETWDDQQLSRAERKALKGIVEDAGRPDDERHRFRRRAFELATGFLTEAPSGEVLAWLEDVVRALWPASQAAAGSTADAEALFSPGGAIVERVAAMFDAARHAVDVCVFTITDDRIARAMNRAHQRGVKLRVVTDDDKSHDLGSDVAKLEQRGVRIRDDRSDVHMHHKFAIFDGNRVLTGSYNWTRSANDHNFENAVVLSDPGLVRQFQTEFDRLWDTFK